MKIKRTCKEIRKNGPYTGKNLISKHYPWENWTLGLLHEDLKLGVLNMFTEPKETMSKKLQESKKIKRKTKGK